MGSSGDSNSPSPPLPPSSSSFSDNWKERIFIPTLLAIVTGCYCGAREFVRLTRKSEPDDLIISAIAGFGSGTLLGRLQAQVPVVNLVPSVTLIIFAVVVTTVDFAAIKLRPTLTSFRESIDGEKEKKGSWFKLPEWSPIQVLDEEALADKEAREKQLYTRRALGKLSKEES